MLEEEELGRVLADGTVDGGRVRGVVVAVGGGVVDW